MPENSIIPEIRVHSPSSEQNCIASRKELFKLPNGSVDGPFGVDGWKNPFHMRTANLANFPTNSSGNRISYRPVVNRARIGITTSAAKSLNILRTVLQSKMNEEINEILQKYLQDFFHPAAENIKQNLGANAVSEQHIQTICRQILEEAKKMYFGSNPGRSSSPNGNHSLENARVDEYSDNEQPQHQQQSISNFKRKNFRETDSGSESGSISRVLLKPSVRRKRPKITVGARGRSTPVKEPIRREGPKWDPKRLTNETKFVLGSKANKALGFGATRGRLYTKHADLFRYIGDQEDKQWLHEHGLMPLAGGRAYLLIKEDIHDLIDSEEYQNASGVNAQDMGNGFKAPQSMITKMRSIMESMRTGDSTTTNTTTTTTTTTINSPTTTTTATRNNVEMSNSSRATVLTTATSSILQPNDSSLGSCNSNLPSVESTNRSESRGISPADELVDGSILPGNASPFNMSVGLSPALENQQVSPLGSDISSYTFNDIQL